MAKKIDWSKAPKANTNARVDFYKKNKLKMDETTKLKKDTTGPTPKPKPKPNPRKKPTANEMKADGTRVSKLNLESTKRASDNNAIDLYEDARDGMRKTRLKIQQAEYDQERRDREDKDKEGMTLSQRNKYDADKTTKAIKDYQLSRKDNQSIAKMIKKVKNSNCGSPSKALVFQPKNLNQHLDTKPTPNNSTVEEENKDPKKDGKEVKTDKEKQLTLNTIKEAKTEGASEFNALNNATPMTIKNPFKKKKNKKEPPKDPQTTGGNKAPEPGDYPRPGKKPEYLGSGTSEADIDRTLWEMENVDEELER